MGDSIRLEFPSSFNKLIQDQAAVNQALVQQIGRLNEQLRQMYALQLVMAQIMREGCNVVCGQHMVVSQPVFDDIKAALDQMKPQS